MSQFENELKQVIVATTDSLSSLWLQRVPKNKDNTVCVTSGPQKSQTSKTIFTETKGTIPKANIPCPDLKMLYYETMGQIL
jgi:hypothetical protein